ncbi:TonB-dependent receptor [Kineobactrum salinum]|uniref:TonB-dependent receptor n=1 Tax=Kineobactrum salinum TaxID=2708301 RepID=A0A6C0TZB3_9GAMM|nr:TonB-dependent receptor [Kineobactrum salinum]QIB65106.1 TonB-dependent receptor [Kineobactrum salinum]
MKATEIRLLVAASVMISGMSAVAQSESGREGRSASGAYLIEEVRVTAQRRETDLGTTPVSATVFSGAQLEDVGIGTLDAIAIQTPNFNYVDTGLQPRYRIRGDGLQVFNDTSDSPVGFAVDDIFYGAGALQRAPLYDIERVEVLRGPQGTLFGRNTTAGLVQVFTKKPTDSFEAYLRGETGSYDRRKIEAAVSGPLADGVRGRLALYYDEDDGWQKNLALPDGRRWAARDILSGRGQIAFDLGSEATLQLKAAHTRDRSGAPMAGTHGALDPVTLEPCTDERILAYQCVNGTGFDAGVPDPEIGFSEYDGMPNHLDFDEYGAQLNWSLTPSLELVAITGYLDYERIFQEDGDGSAVGGFLGNASAVYTLEAEQFSQELQLRGGADTGMTWVLGSFYYNDDKVSTSTLPELFGDAIDTTGTVETESTAVFASADMPLSPTIGVTLGGRYTRETKELDLLFATAPSASYRVSVNEFTWKSGVNWHPADAVYLYANAATGYKSPDFNTNLLFGDADAAAPTRPETSMSLETGAKWTLDRRLSLSAAAFRNRVEDKQATVTQVVNGLPVARLFNFGDVEIYGAELEFTGKFMGGLTTQLGIAVLETEIDAPATTTYSTGPAGDVTPIDGNELPGTPNYTINGLVRFDFSPSSTGQFALQGDFNYQGSQYFQLDNNERDTEDDYGVLNLRAFWNDNDDRINLQVFVENVADTSYASYIGTWNGFDTRYIWWGRTRTWGVKVGFNF